MLTNAKAERVRSVAALARRPVRSRRGLFLAEGPQVVREALVHRPELVAEVYVDHRAAEGDGPIAGILERAQSADVAVTPVAPAVMAAMCDTQRPQGILAVCRVPSTELDRVLAAREGKPRLLTILAAVRDPGNAGTVIRSADAAGADGVVFTADSVDPLNPKCVRSTAGSLFHLPIGSAVPIEEVMDRLRRRGLRVLAADGTAQRSVEEVDLVAPHAWLLGNEAWGLPQALRDQCDEAVRVPIYGKAESLNLAMAATVCLYASATAQRGAQRESRPGASS